MYKHTNLLKKGNASVKLCIYKKIFYREFNINFNKRKKDRCDLCAEIDIKGKTEIFMKNFKVLLRNISKRNKAWEMKETEIEKINNTSILCFDLENVLQ